MLGLTTTTTGLPPSLAGVSIGKGAGVSAGKRGSGSRCPISFIGMVSGEGSALASTSGLACILLSAHCAGMLSRR